MTFQNANPDQPREGIVLNRSNKGRRTKSNRAQRSHPFYLVCWFEEVPFGKVSRLNYCTCLKEDVAESL